MTVSYQPPLPWHWPHGFWLPLAASAGAAGGSATGPYCSRIAFICWAVPVKWTMLPRGVVICAKCSGWGFMIGS